MPALRKFHTQLTTLLAIPAQFDEFDRLVSHYVPLDPLAHECWFRFHDEVEEQMIPDYRYSGVKDVASKAAENAARLACCLHIFGNSPDQPIGRETMADACSLMRWYLDEAVRFGQVNDLTDEVRHAEMLEEWLVRHHREKAGADITVNMVRQKGPGALRVRIKLDAAVELLQDLGRIRVIQTTGTKKRYIMIAPSVIKEWS
jgi:hypothetical protein